MMQQQATKFIDVLEEQELLSPEIVEELRRQVSDSKTRLTPELLAKLLVDNGHLTKFQATKLIAQVKEAADGAEADDSDSDSELGFADEELTAGVAEPTGEDSSATKVATVFVDDEEPENVEAEVVEVGPEVTAEAVAVPAAEALPVAVDESGDAFAATPKVTPKVKKVAQKSSPWDSFRILGVGLALALTLIIGFFLVNYFLRGSADDRLARAEEAYEQRSYETAATMYRDFAETWPTHESASFAKVRAALASLRDAAEGAPDPKVGLEKALEVLPQVAEEPALREEQDDLSGALISLAGKFTERADQRESTAERKELMTDMDRLMALIDDPKYVGQAQKNAQAPTLDRIGEDRARILREISRDEKLVASLAEIDEQLNAQDTMAAYQTRAALISEYPLLEANPELIKRVEQASAIQQALVSSGEMNPTVSPAPPASLIGKSYILGNTSGKAAPGLADTVVFAKVKGSVYGLKGETGEILWRKYVGQEFDADPVRIGEGSDADALICQPEKGQVARVDGFTGEYEWFVDFGEPVHMPVVESQDLFVASFGGEVTSLDLGSGQVMWSKKLPQPVLVSPGAAFNKSHLYIPAEHSNLYMLSRNDGTCQEVLYTGHRPGSMIVSPILLLGQLFLFENTNSESAKVRIFSTSPEGLQLKEAQTPFTVDGNIIVQPQVDRRRLIVQSDLGQILVLDIEPTVETNKVSQFADRPKNLFSPQLSWLVAGDNTMWVADKRFTRFDLQVSMGKINGTWSKHDGDQFTGRPERFGEVIVHSRTLRGNLGVRVAAADAETGTAFWETDLGVPVTFLTKSGSKYDAINSSGMLFQLNGNELRTRADLDAGQGKGAMLFAHPIQLSESTTAMMNESRANQLALYSSQGEKLKLVAANLGGAVPACEPIAVDGKLAVGLDNGQFVLVDPSNGALASSPYQPPMKAGRKVVWNRPVLVPDANTLVVASSLLKLVRLSVGDTLRALTETDLEAPLTGPLVMVGERVGAVQSAGAGEAFVLFDTTSLQRVGSVPLAGNLVAGPFPTSSGCLVQTNSSLMAISGEGQVLWTIDFPSSELLGPPVEVAGDWILVNRSGQIFVAGSADGAIVGQNDAQQPFSSAPLVLAKVLLVGSDEGAVLALPIPSAGDAVDGGAQ